MANLYQIRQEIENFEFECDPETGEFLNALEWDNLQMSFEDKVENIACYVKNLASDVLDFKAEEKQLAERRKTIERKIEYFKQMLVDNLKGEKFSTVKCAVSFRKAESVEVEDIKLVPAELLRVKTTVEPDKTAIKKAIKDGREIGGCKLVESLNIQLK